ncbi:hypothetical protein IWX49DRAFT_349446 [Phyllosticta citricarpa]
MNSSFFLPFLFLLGRGGFVARPRCCKSSLMSAASSRRQHVPPGIAVARLTVQVSVNPPLTCRRETARLPSSVVAEAGRAARGENQVRGLGLDGQRDPPWTSATPKKKTPSTLVLAGPGAGPRCTTRERYQMQPMHDGVGRCASARPCSRRPLLGPDNRVYLRLVSR